MKTEDPRVKSDFLHIFLKMDFDYLIGKFPKSSWWKTEKFSLNWVPDSSNILQSNVFCILTLSPFWFMKTDSDRWRSWAAVRVLASQWPHFPTEISKGREHPSSSQWCTAQWETQLQSLRYFGIQEFQEYKVQVSDQIFLEEKENAHQLDWPR